MHALQVSYLLYADKFLTVCGFFFFVVEYTLFMLSVFLLRLYELSFRRLSVACEKEEIWLDHSVQSSGLTIICEGDFSALWMGASQQCHGDPLSSVKRKKPTFQYRI